MDSGRMAMFGYLLLVSHRAVAHAGYDDWLALLTGMQLAFVTGFVAIFLLYVGLVLMPCL